MDTSSASRTAGVVLREATLAGQVYLLSQPDKVRKAADEEAVVISRRLDMLPALAQSCAAIPELERAAWRSAYIDKMMCGIASPQEWSAYTSSLWHLAFRFWNALDPKHKENRTLLDGVRWSYELLNNDDVTMLEIDALWLAIRCVSQEDAVKNSSSGSNAPASTPSTDSRSTVAGQPSTITS